MKTETPKAETKLSPMEALRLKAEQMAAKCPTPKRTKAGRECACGCKGMTKGGIWLPGHDAKALSAMLAQIRAPKPAAAAAA